MNARIAAVQEKLKAMEIDAFLVGSPQNRRYLTGFTGTSGWALITEKEAYFLTDSRYIIQARQQAKGCMVVPLERFEPVLSIRKVMEELKLDILGVECEHTTLAAYDALTKQFGRKAVVPVKRLVDDLRMIKDEDEIALLAKAEAIGDAAFEHILSFIKPGVSEKEIALELEFFMRQQGASGLSFDSIVASGARSEMPHGVASDKKIAVGDLITLDYGCVYEGYCSDMTRTIAVGQVDDRQRTMYDLVLKAQMYALENLRAGMTGREVDQLARDVFQQAGVLQYFTHSLGHSIGMEIHEEPRFSHKEEMVIQPNMAMSVEPGLYYGGCGVRIEDLVVVKAEGCVNLTNSPKELIIV